MKRTIHLSHWPPFDAIPSNIEVFTPHRRAADAIGSPRRTLEEHAWQLLYRNGLNLADATERHVHLSAAVSEVMSHAHPGAVAEWLRPSIEALLRSGTKLADLKDDDSERVRQLAAVANRYLERLSARDLVDPAEALWRAAELETERRPILVYGYFRPRIDELALIDAIVGDGGQMILPSGSDSIFKGNREAIDYLLKRGWETVVSETAPRTYGERVAERFIEGGSADAIAAAYDFPDIEAEVRGVLAQVKELLLEETPASEIVIIARDERLYGPMLEAVGWEYGVPVNLLYKIPIDETRFGGWLKQLIEAVTSGFEFEPVAQMMSHSLGPGLPHDVWVESRKVHTSSFEGWAEAGVDLSALNWPDKTSRSAWTGLLIGALDRFEIMRRSAAWARELTAYNTFYTGHNALLFDDGNEIVTLEEFAGDVRGLLSTLTVSYQPGESGIEVHDPQSLFGASYRFVFVVGMVEGIVPAPMGQDPVLDFFERKRLIGKGVGLESAADVSRREAISFYLSLLAARERVTFSCPRLIGKDATLPSPYLKRMGITAVSAAQAPLASPEEALRVFLRDGAESTSVTPSAVHSLAVEERRERSVPYDEYDGVTGRTMDAVERTWSSSQLTTLGQCPFKWFVNKVLCVNEPQEMDGELTPAMRGTLYHKVLGIALAGTNAVENPRSTALERLEEAFAKAEKEVVIPHLPAWHAQRMEHIATLRSAIESPDFIDEGASVIGTEKDFSGECFGLKVRGIIDRIDRTADGIVMIDYKAGASVPAGVKDEHGRALIDIQLPIYVRAAGNKLYPGERVTGAYYSLGKAKVLKRLEDGDPSQLDELAGRVRSHLREGSYPVDPDNDGKACNYCDYDAVCRKGARLSWKRSE